MDNFEALLKGEIDESNYKRLEVFKVGQRVKVERGVGKIVRMAHDFASVEHDEKLRNTKNHAYGHNCDGYAKDGHGWNYRYSSIELITEET